MVALDEFAKLHKKRVKANMPKTLKALLWLTALTCILVVDPCPNLESMLFPNMLLKKLRNISLRIRQIGKKIEKCNLTLVFMSIKKSL